MIRLLGIAFAIWLNSSFAFAQPQPLRICVIEDAPGNGASHLAKQLAGRKLNSGSTIAPVRITVHDKKAVRADVERADCAYAVTLWEHWTNDNPPANIPSSANPPTENIHDWNTVGYQLRKAGTKKVILSQTAPPLTVYVRLGRRIFNPYALFADKIVAKLNTEK